MLFCLSWCFSLFSQSNLDSWVWFHSRGFWDFHTYFPATVIYQFDTILCFICWKHSCLINEDMNLFLYWDVAMERWYCCGDNKMLLLWRQQDNIVVETTKLICFIDGIFLIWYGFPLWGSFCIVMDLSPLRSLAMFFLVYFMCCWVAWWSYGSLLGIWIGASFLLLFWSMLGGVDFLVMTGVTRDRLAWGSL